MDEEKLWLLQHASELQRKLKLSEKSLSEEEFKFNLVDAIEKAVEKEKIILEVRINEIQLQAESLKIENKMLKDEVQSKDLAFTKLQAVSQAQSTESIYSMAKMSTEIQFLNHKLELASKEEEMSKSHIEELRKKFDNFQAKYRDSSSSYSVEILKSELLLKDSIICELENKLKKEEEYAIQIERKSSSISDSHYFHKQVSFLDENQKEISRKLQEAYLTIADKDQKIFNFLAEYEKKAPQILQQKENYEKLIISHEELKVNFNDSIHSTQVLQSKIDKLQTELEKVTEEKIATEKSCKNLCAQLSNLLSSSPNIHDTLSFSSIEELIKNNMSITSKLQGYDAEISVLTSRIKELEARPLIVEEIVESIDYQKFASLELTYQMHEKLMKTTQIRAREFEVENTTLNARLKAMQTQEAYLQEINKNISRENSLMKDQLRELEFKLKAANIPVINIQPQPGYKTLYESSLNDYRAEIERLKKYNAEAMQALKSSQKQLILSHEENKQKICEILNEKSLIYIEFKKLEVKILDMEKKFSDKEKELLEEIKKKEKAASQIDTKEFAAINELNITREFVDTQKLEIERLVNQVGLLQEENNILHSKLSAVSQQGYNQAVKAKLDDSMQLSNILKYNCELYEKELKELRAQNIDLDQKLYEAQKEITENSAKLQNIVRQPEAIIKQNESSLQMYEEKIEQLLSDLERKDKQIVSLVSMFGYKEPIPDIMSRVVAVLHKASKVIRK